MLKGAKNTVQGVKMAFGTPFLVTPFGVALRATPMGAKNTVQGAKMAFGTPFLATFIGVALSVLQASVISKEKP